MVNRLFLLAGVGALALACRRNDTGGTSLGTDGGLAQNDAAASSVEVMPLPRAIPEQESTMRRGRRDPTSLFMRAASMLSVNYARQTTLEGVQSSLASDETKLAAAFDTLRTDLVADIRRGTLNASRLKSDEAAVERAARALTRDEAEGLNAVHAACDPVERKTVVDHVRFLPGAREASGAGPDGENGDRESREDRSQRRLDKMTADLELDEEQQSKVADIALDAQSTNAERDARQKRLQALLAAFTTDSFDAKPILVSKESSAAHDMAHREVVLVSRLLPILRPPQREKLAQSVSRRLGHGRGDAGAVGPLH